MSGLGKGCKMKKYIKVTRNDADGSYIQPFNELHQIIDGEFDGFEYIEPGTSITLEVIELADGEYESLPEFAGW